MHVDRWKPRIWPVVVIGAGQAGVALSYWLKQQQLDHVVLERDRPFADWYRRRWDSFHMNTPNWLNVLPGESIPFAPDSDRGAFGTLEDARRYFEAYLQAVEPPVRIESVEAVARDADGLWVIQTATNRYRARNVAMCTGHAARPSLPNLAAELPASVRQIHSSQYRNPEQVTTSNILVVGSGSSGVQICHELAANHGDADVRLSCSDNFTLPFSVCGLSTYRLMKWLGIFRITRDSWLGRRMFPGLLRKGDVATPPSTRKLKRKYGVQLVGKVRERKGDAIHCEGGTTIPIDDLSIVWCTGFTGNWEFLTPEEGVALFDDAGRPLHKRGVAEHAPGLYFVGLRFQHTFLSQDIAGVGADARHIADAIAKREQPLRDDSNRPEGRAVDVASHG